MEKEYLTPTAHSLNTADDYHLLQPLLPPIHAEVIRDSHNTIFYDGMNPTNSGGGGGGGGGGDVSYTSSISEQYIQSSQEWKDHLCDFCIHGPCHPSLLCGCCFPSLGIAQVFFRLLQQKHRKVLLFWFIVSLVLIQGMIGYFMNIQVTKYCWTEEVEEEEEDDKNNNSRYGQQGPGQDLTPLCVRWILLQKGISFGFFLITVLFIAIARHMVRKRYHIKPCIRTQYLCPTCCCCCCGGGSGDTTKRNVSSSSSSTHPSEEEWLEDCCISCCCPTCVTCQVMRQTGNYETYRASCCSYSGLPSGIHSP